MRVGDLVRYDPNMFRQPTLTEQHARPFGWLRDDYEGVEQDWVGVVIKVDENMWGSFGGMGYEIMWSHGYKEKVYCFEVIKVLDNSEEL